MPVNLSASEQLAYSTVRIETTGREGAGSGTGFFYRFVESEDGNENVPAIVTNKHVVAGTTEGTFVLTKMGASIYGVYHRICSGAKGSEQRGQRAKGSVLAL